MDKINNRKTKKIIMIAIVAVFLVIGISYAYLTVSITGKKTNVIKVGSLDLILDENASNGITIENGFAITDEEGLLSDGSSFSIVNNGNSEVCYKLYLDDLELTEGEVRVNDKFIKYSLDKGNTVGKASVLTNIGENPNRLLDDTTIKSQEKIDYKLRLWFNSEENGNYAGQIFKGRLRVEAIQCISNSKPMMKAYDMPEYSYDEGMWISVPTEDYFEYRVETKGVIVKNDTMVPSSDNLMAGPWDVSAAGDNSVVAYIVYDVNHEKANTILYIGGDGGVLANPDSPCFATLNHLSYLDIRNLDTSNVINMDYYFGGCQELSQIDFSSLNTVKVTSMSKMFVDCQSLDNIDLSYLDTSNVTNMEGMFYGCSSLTTTNLNINTKKVTNMSHMFELCSSLVMLNLNSFDITNVLSMEAMFCWCENLSTIQVNNSWTLDNINTTNMFESCGTDHVTIV